MILSDLFLVGTIKRNIRHFSEEPHPGQNNFYPKIILLAFKFYVNPNKSTLRPVGTNINILKKENFTINSHVAFC